MNFSILQNNIYTWINTESGFVTIWQYANAPRPTRPYVSLLIPTITPVGQTEMLHVDDAGIITIRSQNLMTLSIIYHGQEAAQDMSGQEVISRILLSTKKEYVNQIFRDSGMGYLTRLAQNTLQNLVATSFEEQVILDLLFLLVTDITDDVGLIERVEMSGEYLYEDGSLRHVSTIIVED